MRRLRSLPYFRGNEKEGRLLLRFLPGEIEPESRTKTPYRIIKTDENRGELTQGKPHHAFVLQKRKDIKELEQGRENAEENPAAENSCPETAPTIRSNKKKPPEPSPDQTGIEEMCAPRRSNRHPHLLRQAPSSQIPNNKGVDQGSKAPGGKTQTHLPHKRAHSIIQ